MRVWQVLVLSMLFGLTSLFATPPASLPTVENGNLAERGKPAELSGKVTYTTASRQVDGSQISLRVEVQPDGEVVTIRDGNEARFRLRPDALAKLAAALLNTPTYLAPEGDFADDFGTAKEVILLYPDSRTLSRHGLLSRDLPHRIKQLHEWLGEIELHR